MDILFVASELAPAVKASSLADSVFALSKTLKNLGHKITIALPHYPAFERSGVLAARRLTPLALPSTGIAGRDAPREVTVFDGRLASGVELVLFDAKLPDGSPLFADPDRSASGQAPSLLDATRAATFCRAVVELMRQRVASDQPFDVVHAHDWMAAMVPYLMRLAPELAVTQSVLTIHDVRNQGMFERDTARAALAAFGLSDDHFTPSTLEFYGGLNMLKGGVLSADAVTTVSPTYAAEIVRPESTHRLDGVLRARKEPIVGIVHGVDYAVWNPATDPALVARYDGDDASNKSRCKTTLLAELGLELDPTRPLFVAMPRHPATDSRSNDEGMDVLAAALPRLLKQDLSLLVAISHDPTPDPSIEAALRRAPERAQLLRNVSDSMKHRLLGAADFVILPARLEPCGTTQMRAQRYGALPLATRTSGYVDTIVDLDVTLETGTGFHLEPPPTVESIVGGVGRALASFVHPRFGAVRRRAMRLDVSWDRPSRRYVQVYRQLVKRELGGAPAATTSPEAAAKV